MRRIDETPLDPAVLAQLDAIDATLAGEPVDPQHAELAELALLLAAEKPQVPPDFARTMDQAVAERFSRPGRGARDEGLSGFTGRWSWMAPLAGVSAALAAAAIVVVVAFSGGGGSSSGVSNPATELA